MALRAVESANAWKVSTALPVKCVKWADTELTANQVTLMAIAACLYHLAFQGEKSGHVSALGRDEMSQDLCNRQTAGRPQREGQWD